MHCIAIHKQEKSHKRWKLKCTLCGQGYRPVDYFLSHRGPMCRHFRNLNMASLFTLIEPIFSPQELLYEQLGIVSAACNISSRQIASPEFKAFIFFILQNPSIREVPFNYNLYYYTNAILQTYSKNKESALKSCYFIKTSHVYSNCWRSKW